MKEREFKFICPYCGKDASLKAYQTCTEERYITAIEVEADGEFIGYTYDVTELYPDNDAESVFHCSECGYEWDSLTALQQENAIKLL